MATVRAMGRTPMEHVRKHISDVQKLRGTLAVSTAATAKSFLGFSLVNAADAKDAKVGEAVAALQAMRDVTRALLGKSGLTISLPASVSFSTTTTTGLANTAANVLATTAVEFATVAALFDEYRVRAVDYDFHASGQSGQTTGSSSPNNMLALAYDPVDGTAPANLIDLCQLEQHRLFGATPASSAGGAAVSSLLITGPYGAAPLRFHATMPKVTALAVTSSGVVVSMPGQWKSTIETGSVDNGDGRLKIYFATTSVAGATPVVAGILYYHCQFRSRD